MKSALAIHLSECLKNVDGIEIHWRAIKKYADDWEERNKEYQSEDKPKPKQILFILSYIAITVFLCLLGFHYLEGVLFN